MLYFSTKPLKLSVTLGAIAFSIGLIYSIYVILGQLFNFTNALTGWSSTIILIIFFGGIQLLTIGVLGQYIGVLLTK